MFIFFIKLLAILCPEHNSWTTRHTNLKLHSSIDLNVRDVQSISTLSLPFLILELLPFISNIKCPLQAYIARPSGALVFKSTSVKNGGKGNINCCIFWYNTHTTMVNPLKCLYYIDQSINIANIHTCELTRSSEVKRSQKLKKVKILPMF